MACTDPVGRTSRPTVGPSCDSFLRSVLAGVFPGTSNEAGSGHRAGCSRPSSDGKLWRRPPEYFRASMNVPLCTLDVRQIPKMVLEMRKAPGMESNLCILYEGEPNYQPANSRKGDPCHGNRGVPNVATPRSAVGMPRSHFHLPARSPRIRQAGTDVPSLPVGPADPGSDDDDRYNFVSPPIAAPRSANCGTSVRQLRHLGPPIAAPRSAKKMPTPARSWRGGWRGGIKKTQFYFYDITRCQPP
jgi:hypothetical protein